MRIDGSVIWITGASSGIGAALAVACARRGARLILSARRTDRLEEVRERCGAEGTRVLALDVADSSSFEGTVSRAEAFWGRIDVLVNNAGVSQRSLFEETDPAVVRRLVETDFLGPVLFTRAVLPGMIRRRAGQIVLITSLTGRVATPLRTIYSASKHALHGFADSLRAELHRHRIAVCVVAPGFVRTDSSVNALSGNGSANGRRDRGQAEGVSAERCAAGILRALERDRPESYVGLGFRGRAALFLKRFAPGLLRRIIRSARVT
jgi:short-subunit dehydrogenase